jgi:sucrose phosphorylase
MEKLLNHLAFLYGKDKAPQLYDRAQKILDGYRARIEMRDGELTECDSMLITYGDQIQSPDQNPLQTLNKFCEQYLANIVSGIHILPFYPWTSDDGFWL